MADWWNALSLLQQVLYLVAIPSTLVLLLQTILLLVGMGHDADGDMDSGHDIDGNHDFDSGRDMCGEHDHDTGHGDGLRLLTLRGIIAFLTVFSWVGIALLDVGMPTVLGLLLALAGGTTALFLVAILLHMATRMQQSGNLDLGNAVGRTGEVYVPIHDGQKGKVTLVFQERFLELDAVAPGCSLKTGAPVRVVGVEENGVLVVAPLEVPQA